MDVLLCNMFSLFLDYPGLLFSPLVLQFSSHISRASLIDSPNLLFGESHNTRVLPKKIQLSKKGVHATHSTPTRCIT